MTITRIGIVGSGQMGSGIAQVFATAGFDVVVCDISKEFLELGKKAIETSLTLFVAKGKMTVVERDAILQRIFTTTLLDDVANADLIVEAATEDVKLKLELFTQLDAITRPDAILASNTSSIPIAKLAAATKHPSRVIGMHFMNPPALMKGVEVIRSRETADQVEQAVTVLVEQIGKSPIHCQDHAGFVANRILMPMIREAIVALEEGVAKRDDIDRCMVDCCRFPMGPLALADLIGLDTCHSIMNVMADGLHEERFRPPELLQQMVRKGELGRKTKRGFYVY